ncbi:MAG: nuclear transport factor 2 family protein [Bacteroidota bacterium]
MYFLLFLYLLPFISFAQTSEEEKILTIVDQFFSSMEDKDVELAKSLLHTEGHSFRMISPSQESDPEARSFATYLASLGEAKAKWREEAIEPKVFIDHNLAMVWTRYKFYIDDTFSHCGTDAFTLTKSKEGWKIVNLSYTVQKEGCE